MVRAALTGRTRMARGPVRFASLIPAASVVAASLLVALPIVSVSGWWPDFGYMALISWRLLDDRALVQSLCDCRALPVGGLSTRVHGACERLDPLRCARPPFNRSIQRHACAIELGAETCSRCCAVGAHI